MKTNEIWHRVDGGARHIYVSNPTGRTFEDFLKIVHAELFPTLLDDDISDHFDDWIGGQEPHELMKWAELYGKSQYILGKEEILKL